MILVNPTEIESLPKRWQKQVLAATKHMVAKGALQSPKKLRFQIPDSIKQGLHPKRQSSRVRAKRASHRKPAQGSKSSKLIGLSLQPKAGSNRRFHASKKTARKSNEVEHNVRGDANFEAPGDNFVESAFRIFAGIVVADHSSFGAELAPEYEEHPITIQEHPDHAVCNHLRQIDELEKLNQELSNNLNQSKKQVFYVENLLNVANEDVEKLKKELNQCKGPADGETSEIQSSLGIPIKATEIENSNISVLELQLLDSQGQVAKLTSEIQTLNDERATDQQKSNLQKIELNNLLLKFQEQNEEYLKSVQQQQAEKEYLISDLNSVTSLNQELQVMLQAKVDEIETKNQSIGELLDRIQDLQSNINKTLDIERECEQRNVDYEQELTHRTLEFQKTSHALDFAESEILNLHSRIGAKDEEINVMRVLAQEILETAQKLVGRAK